MGLLGKKKGKKEEIEGEAGNIEKGWKIADEGRETRKSMRKMKAF